MQISCPPSPPPGFRSSACAVCRGPGNWVVVAACFFRVFCFVLFCVTASQVTQLDGEQPKAEQSHFLIWAERLSGNEELVPTSLK